MGTTLKPLRDKIVVKKVEAEEKTAGGIILPDTAKEKPQEGIVIAVGPGRLLENGQIKEPDVKKGDRVIFGSYAGNEIKIGDETLLVLSESEVLAIVEGASKGQEVKSKK